MRMHNQKARMNKMSNHYWEEIEEYWRTMEAQANAPAIVQVPELARRANDLWVLIHAKSGACLPYRARPDRAFIDEFKPKGLNDE